MALEENRMGITVIPAASDVSGLNLGWGCANSGD